MSWASHICFIKSGWSQGVGNILEGHEMETNRKTKLSALNGLFSIVARRIGCCVRLVRALVVKRTARTTEDVVAP